MRKDAKYEKIEIKKIKTEGQLIRVSQDDDHVIELASSISTHGLLEPIVVVPADKGKYQLVAGAHRLAAVKRLGWETVPAMVRETDIEEPIKGLALIENVIRKDLSLREEMEAVKYLLDVDKLSMSQACQLLGKGRRWVEMRLQALNYPEDVREELIAERLTLPVAEVLAGIDDVSIRNMIMNAAQTGRWGAKQTEAMRDTYLATENFTEAVEAGVEHARVQTLSEPAGRCCELCGTRRVYVHLKPLWICTDRMDCDAHIQEKEHEEKTAGVQ